MKIKPIILFCILCICFLTYSFSIYLQPVFKKQDASIDINKAVNGRLVWQKYNCQSCHQIYGLGGYLGPDLTNIMSAKGKGEQLVRAYIYTGNETMPSYSHMPENEIVNMLEFLKQADKSGSADYRTFEVSYTGMIEQK